jgi:hypothetical protein
MIKNLILLLLFTNFLIGKAQEISLKTIYPEPRVGQSIPITLDLDFIEDFIKESLPLEMEFTGYSAFTNYSRDIQVNDTGYFQIGPYLFEFNKKKYHTDSINIHVIEPLEKREGIWIRLLEFDSTQFLVAEQYLGNQWEKDKKSKDKLSMSISTYDLEFAGLIEKPIEGLEFYQRQSSTNNVSMDDKNPFGASLGYSRLIYRVINETGEDIMLAKKFFENFPKKSEVPELIIKKTN